MHNRKKRRTYDLEFKKEAVRLVLEEGYSAAEVERNLGIGHNIVYRWVREITEDAEHAFPGKGRLKPPDEQIRALERELARVKRERDILKKAVTIFSTDPDRYSDS
jgi:transposase